MARTGATTLAPAQPTDFAAVAAARTPQSAMSKTGSLLGRAGAMMRRMRLMVARWISDTVSMTSLSAAALAVAVAYRSLACMSTLSPASLNPMRLTRVWLRFVLANDKKTSPCLCSDNRPAQLDRLGTARRGL